MKMAEVWCPNFLEGSTSFPIEQRSIPSFSPRPVNGAASRQFPTYAQSEETLKTLSEGCVQHCKYAFPYKEVHRCLRGLLEPQAVQRVHPMLVLLAFLSL
jgi:hypothetical protein